MAAVGVRCYEMLQLQQVHTIETLQSLYKPSQVKSSQIMYTYSVQPRFSQKKILQSTFLGLTKDAEKMLSSDRNDKVLVLWRPIAH